MNISKEVKFVKVKEPVVVALIVEKTKGENKENVADERPKIKSRIPKKPKACPSIEMSKILGINLTMRCYDSKRSNVMKNMEPNEKLQSYVIKFCGRSYMHIYIYIIVEAERK